ncbi:hypothetical protein P5673_022982 [Acropora cervicornis]|uniref:Uncharacterized protein n=1 Tax=Acropora cervicornis TaxID=6130 RepID=A0AAD9UZJ2_ACRCE|nr:hypothetical protein P5673_022982 [Acropora cervicornis]
MSLYLTFKYLKVMFRATSILKVYIYSRQTECFVKHIFQHIIPSSSSAAQYTLQVEILSQSCNSDFTKVSQVVPVETKGIVRSFATNL